MAFAEPEEVGVLVFEVRFHLCAVWTVADDDEVDGFASLLDSAHNAGPDSFEHWQVFFGAHASAEHSFDRIGRDGMLIPDVGIAKCWIELGVVEPGGEAEEFIFVDADGFEAAGVVVRACEYESELFIEGAYEQASC